MWSRIKRAAKKVWRIVKAAVRVGVRVGLGIAMRAIHIIGSALDPFYMVKKKMRIQVLILRESEAQGLVPDHDLDAAITTAKQIFLDRFKVEIRAYGNPIVQTLPDVAPANALDVGCAMERKGLLGLIATDLGAVGDEFGEAGDYFAGKLAGWVAVPISLRFPITVFVVRSIRGKIGCSIPIADYVTLSVTPSSSATVTGVNSATTMAHELAHTCLLMHRDHDKANLMYPGHQRGTDVTKWQRWVVRTSRHCTWW